MLLENLLDNKVSIPHKNFSLFCIIQVLFHLSENHLFKPLFYILFNNSITLDNLSNIFNECRITELEIVFPFTNQIKRYQKAIKATFLKLENHEIKKSQFLDMIFSGYDISEDGLHKVNNNIDIYKFIMNKYTNVNFYFVDSIIYQFLISIYVIEGKVDDCFVCYKFCFWLNVLHNKYLDSFTNSTNLMSLYFDSSIMCIKYIQDVIFSGFVSRGSTLESCCLLLEYTMQLLRKNESNSLLVLLNEKLMKLSLLVLNFLKSFSSIGELFYIPFEEAIITCKKWKFLSHSEKFVNTFNKVALTDTNIKLLYKKKENKIDSLNSEKTMQRMIFTATVIFIFLNKMLRKKYNPESSLMYKILMDDNVYLPILGEMIYLATSNIVPCRLVNKDKIKRLFLSVNQEYLLFVEGESIFKIGWGSIRMIINLYNVLAVEHTETLLTLKLLNRTNYKEEIFTIIFEDYIKAMLIKERIEKTLYNLKLLKRKFIKSIIIKTKFQQYREYKNVRFYSISKNKNPKIFRDYASDI